MRLVKISCTVVACCLYAALAANGADCDKARQLYETGTKLFSYEARAKTFQDAVIFVLILLRLTSIWPILTRIWPME